MREDAFLGTGMKFPPQIDPSTGRFVVSSARDSVRESVYLILMTNRGERWLRPAFGSEMVNYTFVDTSPTMLHIMEEDLKEMLLKQEPRIGSVKVNIDAKSRQGCLLIDLDYTIAGSSKPENMVFPFYLNAPGGEESEEE